MMEKHNRKSHLAPQLSPGTRALLRGEQQDTPRTATTRGAGGLNSVATPKTATLSRPSTMEAGEISIASPAGVQNGRNSAASSRPGYPARTSSAQTADGYMPQPQYSKQHSQQQQHTALPIRQAPGNRRAVADARVDTSGSERSDESYSRSERSEGSYSRRAPKLGTGFVQ